MRKRKAPEHENHERWLVSYADFITLLFAFFVVLFSSSQVDQRKVGKLAQSIQGAFLELSILPVPESQTAVFDRGIFPTDPLTNVEKVSRKHTTAPPRHGKKERAVLLDDKGMQELMDKLETQLLIEKLAGQVRFNISKRGLTITLTEGAFFESGSAGVRDQSTLLLDRIGELLRNVKNDVRVEGHTDNVPIHTKRYPSNMALSTDRAMSVTTYLVDRHKISPERLSVAGYGEHRPVADNDSLDGRNMNRRVDMVLLSVAAMKVTR